MAVQYFINENTFCILLKTWQKTGFFWLMNLAIMFLPFGYSEFVGTSQ
jgi:hypothetical protein